MPKEKDEIELGLCSKLAEEKIIHSQLWVITLIEQMEKLENGFSTNGYFTLGDEIEYETNIFFFRESSE